jgi:hypothetical protein
MTDDRLWAKGRPHKAEAEKLGGAEVKSAEILFFLNGGDPVYDRTGCKPRKTVSRNWRRAFGNIKKHHKGTGKP